ncbi:MAG: alkaline shock response membrane anchor protein AmaP [Firmicutes bacterium]|nr:alkaline shock response membrane anchor protein AmaP [Bacillota bacterium]
METLRRVLVALGGLLSLALAVLTAVGMINHEVGKQVVDYLDRCFVYNLQQIFVEGKHLWQPIVAFVVLLVIAVLLFIVAFSRTKKANRIRVSTDDGSQIEISLAAVDNVVRRAANSVPQVKDLSTKLNVVNDGLDIDLNVTVPTDAALPAVGSAVRQAVNEQVTTMTGVVPHRVRVQVVKVADKQED